MKRIGDAVFVLACVGAFACGIEPGSAAQTSEPLSTVTMINNKTGILPNVRVIEVLYGAGTYMPNLTNGNIGLFYADVTNSPYMDWLSDYSTPSLPGQTIGRGSFGGVYTITPSAQNSGLTVNFLQIAAEISAQILAHNLPATNAQPSGRSNNLYVVHLPRGVIATVGPPGYQVESCGPGNNGPPGAFFCGYHSQALAWAGTRYDIYQIAILPDFGRGSGCDAHSPPGDPNTIYQPCGTNALNFDNLTAIASHEMIEAVTDPAPGGSWVEYEPPPTLEPEIADICERQYDTFVGGSGRMWTVQKGWSMSRNACVAHP